MSAEHARAPRREEVAALVDELRVFGQHARSVGITSGCRRAAAMLEALAAENERLRAERDLYQQEAYTCSMTCPVCEQYGDGCVCGGVAALKADRDKALAAARALREALTEVRVWEPRIDHAPTCASGVGPDRDCDCARFPLIVHVVDALDATRWLLAAPEPQEPPKGRNK